MSKILAVTIANGIYSSDCGGKLSGSPLRVYGSIVIQTASNLGAITSVTIDGLSSVGADLNIQTHVGAIGPVLINSQTASCAATQFAVAGSVIIQTNVRLLFTLSACLIYTH